MWHSHTGKGHPATTKGTLEAHEGRQGHLETIREVKQVRQASLNTAWFLLHEKPEIQVRRKKRSIIRGGKIHLCKQEGDQEMEGRGEEEGKRWERELRCVTCVYQCHTRGVLSWKHIFIKRKNWKRNTYVILINFVHLLICIKYILVFKYTY